MPSDTRGSPDAEDTASPKYEAPSLTDSAGEDVGGDGLDGGDLEPEATRFNPPGFLDALKTVLRPNGTRQKAQPATGTAADAKAVNYIDRRERLIAAFLSIFQVVLGVVVYFEYRKYVVHPTNKKPKISIAQAHLDTLNYRHEAPELLLINVVLALAIAGGVLSKRRALVGFTIMLGGLGMNASGGGIIGLVYLGIGIWLVFRSMKRTPSARAAAATKKAGGSAGGTGRRGGAAGTTSPAGKAALAPGDRKPPPPSKRYTPPRKRRPAPVKAAVSADPEKESRLTSWLRR